MPAQALAAEDKELSRLRKRIIALEDENRTLRKLLRLRELPNAAFLAAKEAWNLYTRRRAHARLEDTLRVALRAAIAVNSTLPYAESPPELTKPLHEY